MLLRWVALHENVLPGAQQELQNGLCEHREAVPCGVVVGCRGSRRAGSRRGHRTLQVDHLAVHAVHALPMACPSVVCLPVVYWGAVAVQHRGSGQHGPENQGLMLVVFPVVAAFPVGAKGVPVGWFYRGQVRPCQWRVQAGFVSQARLVFVVSAGVFQAAALQRLWMVVQRRLLPIFPQGLWWRSFAQVRHPRDLFYRPMVFRFGRSLQGLMPVWQVMMLLKPDPLRWCWLQAR